jgi:hypothetical protein
MDWDVSLLALAETRTKSPRISSDPVLKVVPSLSLISTATLARFPRVGNDKRLRRADYESRTSKPKLAR